MYNINNNDDDVDDEYIINILKDGRVKLNHNHAIAKLYPPSFDPISGVSIKDVQISSDVSTPVFLRHGAYVTPSCFKFPLVFYIHGGGFFAESPFSMIYTRYVSHLVDEVNVIVVLVDYGLYPHRPIPACYEDSWIALLWVASHGEGRGPDPWINEYADLQRIFVAGDSAGGNIAHTLLVRVGSMGLPEGAKGKGMILAHPFFGKGDKDDYVWMSMCPTNEGHFDRRMKPSLEDLTRLGCERVLVLVAENDNLLDGGECYVQNLIKSGWQGTVDIVKNKGRNHCFHIYNPDDSEAVANMQRIISFIHH